MKVAKSMALMAMGAGALLAYQQYSKPVMKKMTKAADSAVKSLKKD